MFQSEHNLHGKKRVFSTPGIPANDKTEAASTDVVVELPQMSEDDLRSARTTRGRRTS